MKKPILFILLFVCIACKSAKDKPNEITITSKKEVVKDVYTFVINKVISDSRCPEGTNCIWAGELILEVSAWENKLLKETVVLTFSPNSNEENRIWFSKYLPQNNKLKTFKISPTKTENQLALKEYKIELILE
jgi:hypothetical protein